VLYAFIWRLLDGRRPTTILREFTFEQDLTYLLQLIQARPAV
jgi:hypothetical protein